MYNLIYFILIIIGIASKMKELSESSSIHLREASILLLCAMMQSPSILHRKVLLLHRFNVTKQVVTYLRESNDIKLKFPLYSSIHAVLETFDVPIKSWLSSSTFIALLHKDYQLDHYDMNAFIGRCLCSIIFRCIHEFTVVQIQEVNTYL